MIDCRVSGRRSRRGAASSFSAALSGLALRRQRLHLLRAVAIDGQGLQPQPPAFHVGVGHVLGRAVLGHVHRLRDRPGDERLGGRHHADVGLPGDRPRAVARLEGAVEHRQVLGLQLRPRLRSCRACRCRPTIASICGCVVAQGSQGQRHRLVDDLQHPAAGQLLVLHQGDVRLDARRVAIHHEADRAGGGQHRGLGVAEAVAAAVRPAPRPRGRGRPPADTSGRP